MLNNEESFYHQQQEIKEILSIILKNENYKCETDDNEILLEKEVVYIVYGPVFADDESYKKFFMSLKKCFLQLEKYRPHFTRVYEG